MNTKKPIYRFFSAFLITAVLLTAVAPAGLQGKALVKKLCMMVTGHQAVTMVMNDCSCSSMQKSAAKKPAVRNANQERKDCSVAISSSCYMDQASSNKATPLSQNTSAKVVALPVKNIGKSKTSPPRALSADYYTFIKASESAPPLFLKNCSFLN